MGIPKTVAKTVLKPALPLWRRLREELLATEHGYRTYLRLRYGARFPPPQLPRAIERGGTLRTAAQWQAAAEQLRGAGLPVHDDGPKNWDTLIALSEVLSATVPGDAVLDAGAELYSAVLPALFTCGYRRLTGVNLVFKRQVMRGPIKYEPGDITDTRFDEGSFGAITCMSVIEHGVPLAAFFQEMSRLLRPSGVLVVSTDYWESAVDTMNKRAYGAPIHIFDRGEIEQAIALAQSYSLQLVAPVDLTCQERVVRWDAVPWQYTFLALVFRRV